MGFNWGFKGLKYFFFYEFLIFIFITHATNFIIHVLVTLTKLNT